MKWFKFAAMLLFAGTIACSGGGVSGGGDAGEDSVITISAISGVTPPNYGETPVKAITETAQYTGTVSWSPSDATFAATTEYTATIALTAKPGYTLSGVSENFFTVAGTSTAATNSADSGVVTAVFPATGNAPAAVIDIAAISGVTPPAYGQTPVTTITETAQYTGTVSWSPSDTTFAATTAYTATITLTAKPGYTLSGVSENFFTVAGTSTAATNSTDSGVVTAVFSVTGAAAEESGIVGATTVGALGTIKAGMQTAKMIYANNLESITFPLSQPSGCVDYNPATLTRKFYMSETEVTNALMAVVLQWAYDNGKFSTIVSDHNGLNTISVKYGGKELLDLDDTYIKIGYYAGRFSVLSGYENHPVVCVTWYGAIMFCNWLTEMRDGNTANVVYSGIDETWVHSETVEAPEKTGYRLPSSDEWEYAARYVGTIAPTQGDLATEYIARNTNTGHATLTPGYYWTPADYISGAIRDYTNAADARATAWYSGDPDMGGNKLMPVAQKTANQLGLRDISGNVWEWCFQVAGSTNRVIKGGGFDSSDSTIQLGGYNDFFAFWDDYNIGFRFARTQ